jgi:hypothetical protein
MKQSARTRHFLLIPDICFLRHRKGQADGAVSGSVVRLIKRAG